MKKIQKMLLGITIILMIILIHLIYEITFIDIIGFIVGLLTILVYFEKDDN